MLFRSIWNTPWFSAWQNIYNDLIIHPGSFTYPASVNQLMMDNNSTWNEGLLDQLFSQSAANIIKSTPIIPSNDDDILCWKLTPNGKYNSKSGYRLCLQFLHDTGMPKPRKPDELTQQLLNSVWECKEMIPRVKTFAWRILRRAFPSGSRAAARSKHISPLCSRCGLTEDDTHILFLCPFARAAWFDNPWFIRVDILAQNCSSMSDRKSVV